MDVLYTRLMVVSEPPLMDNEHKRSIESTLVVSRDTVVLWTCYKHRLNTVSAVEEQQKVDPAAQLGQCEAEAGAFVKPNPAPWAFSQDDSPASVGYIGRAKRHGCFVDVSETRLMVVSETRL